MIINGFVSSILQYSSIGGWIRLKLEAGRSTQTVLNFSLLWMTMEPSWGCSWEGERSGGASSDIPEVRTCLVIPVPVSAMTGHDRPCRVHPHAQVFRGTMSLASGHASPATHYHCTDEYTSKFGSSSLTPYVLIWNHQQYQYVPFRMDFCRLLDRSFLPSTCR